VVAPRLDAGAFPEQGQQATVTAAEVGHGRGFEAGGGEPDELGRLLQAGPVVGLVDVRGPFPVFVEFGGGHVRGVAEEVAVRVVLADVFGVRGCVLLVHRPGVHAVVALVHGGLTRERVHVLHDHVGQVTDAVRAFAEVAPVVVDEQVRQPGRGDVPEGAGDVGGHGDLRGD